MQKEQEEEVEKEVEVEEAKARSGATTSTRSRGRSPRAAQPNEKEHGFFGTPSSPSTARSWTSAGRSSGPAS